MINKIGMIGGGINSAVGRAHISALSIDGSFKLHSGHFSRDRTIHNLSQQKYKVLKKTYYSSINNYLKNEKGNLDIVLIVLPTPDHYKIIKQCLNLNYHVICEKPFVIKKSQLIELNNLALKKRRFICVTYNYLGYPMLRYLKSKLKSLGKIKKLNIEYLMQNYIINNSSLKQNPQKWRLNENKKIPNIFLDLGTHAESIVYYLFKCLPKYNFIEKNNFSKFNVIDDMICIGELKRNISYNLWISKTSIGYNNGLKIRLFGEKGSLFWEQISPEKIIFTNHNGHSTTFFRDDLETFSITSKFSRFKVGHPVGYIEAYGNIYLEISKEFSRFLKKGSYTNDFIYHPFNFKSNL